MHFWKKEVYFFPKMRLYFLMLISPFFIIIICLFVSFFLSVDGRVGEDSDSGIILAIKSRIIIQSRARCNFRALYDACSVANIPRGVLGTRVNPDTCRISVEGKFDLNPDTWAYDKIWTGLD